MMINNNDDYNLADSILERTFLKVGNKVEKGTTLGKVAQHPEQVEGQYFLQKQSKQEHLG